MYGSSFFTALGDGRTSALLSVWDTLVCLLGFLLLLPYIFGVDGVFMATPAANSSAHRSPFCFFGGNGGNTVIGNTKILENVSRIFYLKVRDQCLKRILPIIAGIHEIPSLALILLQSAVVECLLYVLNDEWNGEARINSAISVFYYI